MISSPSSESEQWEAMQRCPVRSHADLVDRFQLWCALLPSLGGLILMQATGMTESRRVLTVLTPFRFLGA